MSKVFPFVKLRYKRLTPMCTRKFLKINLKHNFECLKKVKFPCENYGTNVEIMDYIREINTVWTKFLHIMFYLLPPVFQNRKYPLI